MTKPVDRGPFDGVDGKVVKFQVLGSPFYWNVASGLVKDVRGTVRAMNCRTLADAKKRTRKDV